MINLREQKMEKCPYCRTRRRKNEKCCTAYYIHVSKAFGEQLKDKDGNIWKDEKGNPYYALSGEGTYRRGDERVPTVEEIVEEKGKEEGKNDSE